MADKMSKTTSSILLENKPASETLMPNRGEAQIVTRLAENIAESYRIVKQKQQKFNDLTNQNLRLVKPLLKAPTDEWQEVCSPKNKLKRKKTLSSSLTSVTDSVNQEKRTRIEGMQLNCRGRLHIKENINRNASTPVSLAQKTEKPVAGKPPLPPSSKQNNTETNLAKTVSVNPPPPRLKRKLQENVQTIQKLNALTEQLRLEINELKTNLNSEKGAVRVLRAQNESEARKWKNEVKKLQNAVELLKKASSTNKKGDVAATNSENMPQTAMGGLVNYEIQRLTNEINALKEANKALEEKKVINCDADRRKAADIRELKDSYEIRLTQIQKSAKTEISRLLEEIKTKERNIGQLKKDLQILQNSKNLSRNATTSNTTITNQTTNKTTISNANAKIQTNKKPKSSISNTTNAAQKQNEESSKETTKNKDLNKKSDNTNEISKLKNIELINNTKNVTATNLQKSTKILNNSQHNNDKENSINENNNENLITIIHLHANDDANDDEKCLNLLQKHHEPQPPLMLTISTQTEDEHLPNNTNTAENVSKTIRTTMSIACDDIDQFDEQHITQELTQHLENKAIQDAKDHHNHNHSHRHHHHHHHHHHQHNHSDSDSALSSAPTSISPQPPANGEEPTDIWQTMRSYTNDIEKLQKEVDSLQKQNEQLKQELNMAKDQIIELETNAMESANNTKIPQLMERIKCLEEQEHQLQAEANDLREQNELLEFRILELEETNDKWSLQSHTNPTSESSESIQTVTVTQNTNQNVWSCTQTNKPDPFEMLFGNNSHSNQNANSIQLDSGIISPQSQHHHDDLIDISNEELCRRLGDILKKSSSLEEDERHCLQQVMNLVQQLDALTPRSGPNSLTATSSSDEASSLDLVKSRISDYSSASSASTSSARSTHESSTNSSSVNSIKAATASTTPSRIVATVQPYNSHQLAPHNTPTDSPRKARCQPWQTNSLSESGVFVESDFFSDISENNVCTQTDFEDNSVNSSLYSPHHSNFSNSPTTKKVPVQKQNSSNLTDQKRLQYYKDRVEVLEGKILIYESCGDVQAKHLAERLQREILLEKEVNELRDRVEILESENSILEEEKCEFEEAENDTRLRLQRLEVELEILSQRNVELEMSREALSAKYKDCHSECSILRDDLATTETQIRHLEEDKQKAKERLEFLHSTLPLLLIFNTYCTLEQVQSQNYTNEDMGNQGSIVDSPKRFQAGAERPSAKSPETCDCHERELHYLKEEVKCLRHQIKELNSRHYAAMESADSHWVDLEREYKEREEQFRAKEMCLKQKIQKLQDCLREDARSANEKICQLEEAEQGLKTCLVRISKEHQKLQEDHELMVAEFERFKEQHTEMLEQQKPLTEALEAEKKRNKGLIDELTFMRKLQQETESQAKKEYESVREQMFDLKKDFLHIEVTNGELREEVATLEMQIQNLEAALKESQEKIRCLTDEIRTKDEICQKLEKRLERSEGYSLADELGDTPSKRFKREDIKDLKTASKGLGQALRHMENCEKMLPTQKQFKTIARDVKKLADTILQGEAPEEEVSVDNIVPQTTELEDENGENNQENPEDEGNFDPNVTSSPNQQSAAPASESAIEPALEPVAELTLEPAPAQPEINVTVGMALIPETQINESCLLRPPSLLKETICEVPSELRKLAEPLTKVVTQANKHSTRTMHKKRGKKCAKTRMTRGRVSNLHIKVKHMLSNLIHNEPLPAFQDASDLDLYESEVLQRNISYGSFHSLKEETLEKIESIKMDASVECEIKMATKDTATVTGTLVEKQDSGIQVNDELAVELQLIDIPAYVRTFLSKLKSSATNTKFLLNSSVFNMKIYKHWRCNFKFRQGLNIVSQIFSFDADGSSQAHLESYEDFVNAMNCLQVLEDLFKPHKIAMLNEIEAEINERLIIFHNRKKESEFYCTVYYPVKRKKNVEKPSEANFDRNNQNLKIKQKINCSSTTSQTISPSERNEMSALMLNDNKPSTTLNGSNVATTTSNPITPRGKCDCKVAEVAMSSSSTSIVSEHFPVKKKMKLKEMPKANYVPPANRTIVITCTAPRPMLLQSGTHVHSKEQYFSCGSEDSEPEEVIGVLKSKSQDHSPDTRPSRTQAILQLLQEIISLLNTNVIKREQPSQTSSAAAATATAASAASFTAVPKKILESEMDLPPPPPPPPPPPLETQWCPCYCFAQGMAMASGQPSIMPYIQPYNIQSAFSHQQPVIQTYVCKKTEDSFKDCLSSSVVSTIANDADFECVQISSVSDEGPQPSQIEEAERPIPVRKGDESSADKLSAKVLEHTDEEIMPAIEIRGSFDHHRCYGPGLDSLEQYEDEEPYPKMNEELKVEVVAASASFDHHKAYGPGLDSLEQYEDEEPYPKMNEELKVEVVAASASFDHHKAYGPGLDSLEQYEDEEPIKEIDDELMVEVVTATASFDHHKVYGPGRDSLKQYEDEEASDQRQMIRYVESEEDESYYPYGESEIYDEDSELAKEKRAESCKKKESQAEDMLTMATTEQLDCRDHLQEMKFFIDSLIMDLEAMEYVRRRTQYEKKVCIPKPSICCRESYPVTITDVQDLGATSLYVKWEIHDCCGIGGYEIYTDGYLTNRFYHAKHEAAVITNVDVTMPHKISLVAQPSTNEETIELICNAGNNKTVRKSLPWKTNIENERKALFTLWTPSVYFYNPTTNPIPNC